MTTPVTIFFPCPKCLMALRAAADRVGATVPCRGCREPVAVPPPPQPAAKLSTPAPRPSSPQFANPRDFLGTPAARRHTRWLKHRGTVLVLGLVVLGGLAVAAVYLLGGGNNKSPVQAAADTADESGSTATAANNQGREQPPRLGEKKDAPGVSRPTTPDVDGDTASWSPLFNGKDLTGWRTVGASRGEWRVSDGAVTFTGGANDANDRHLVSTRADLGDFRLRFEVMVSDGGHGHICFRATPKGATVAGYVVQINSTHPWSSDKTGSLFTMAGERKGRSLAAVRQTASRPDVWVPMEIAASGDRITVTVEGRVVADHTDANNSYPSGSVVLLQPPSDGTRIRFRGVEVNTRTRGGGH